MCRWWKCVTIGILALLTLCFSSPAQDPGKEQASALPSSPPSSPAIPIAFLDSLTRLPGNISALPASPPIPAANPQTPAKIALGKMLFFDTRLSRDGSLSCASCHDPAKHFSDMRPRAIGIRHTVLGRRTPSVLNAAYNPLQFWDGRANSLEKQAAEPILSSHEMAVPDENWLVNRLRQIPNYNRQFTQAFGGPISFVRITSAIAAFERTLITPDSPFDLYIRGAKNALTIQQKRGLILFFGKASCSQCHNGPNFTDNKFHSLGRLSGEDKTQDLGRYTISKKLADRGAFKTPSLRNVVDHTPYMHDGSIATLSEVIAFYNRGGGDGKKSDLIHPLNLTANEQEDLLSFLRSLTGTQPKVEGSGSPRQ